MDFDGVDDRLGLSAVPFQMADDHFVVAGVRTNQTATGAQLFYNGASSGAGRCGSIYMGIGGGTSSLWRDDVSVVVANPSNGTLTAGAPFVLSNKKAGSIGYARKDAGSVASASVAGIGTTTVNTAFIGSLQGTSNYWPGPIYALALGKGTITDAQLKSVEGYIGTLSGVTIS